MDLGLCIGDPGVVVFPAGDYEIFVTGEGAATGTYSFTLWELNDPEFFTIALEEEVSDGMPAPGAGNIEEPGAIDIYTMNVPAGTIVFFEELSGPCTIAWTCEDENGDVVFADNGYCLVSPGEYVLTQGGDYTITARGEGDATGTYGFVANIVDPVQHFVIGLEEVVSDGMPAPGAGNLEEPGAIDVYTFTAAAGTEVFFDELGGGCDIAWECVDAGGATVFSDNGLCLMDPGIHTLALGGTYTITVTGEGTGSGPYSFTIWELNPPDVFTVGYDEFVSDGVPGPGAGNIEEPGTIDIYTFEAGDGDEICFLENGGPCTVEWQVVDPLGGIVFIDNGLCIDGPGSYFLTAGTPHHHGVWRERCSRDLRVRTDSCPGCRPQRRLHGQRAGPAGGARDMGHARR